MTRRDYILIADALKSARGYQASSVNAWAFLYGCDISAFELAKVLARANPRFDRERFLLAAGAHQEGVTTP